MSTQTKPDDAKVLAESTDVLIVGAGPVGLTLALELNRYGIDVVLIERNATSTRHPKMDITNGRSMELYRRLGIADDLRSIAIPSTTSTKVTWATNAVGWELTSFEYPSVDEQRATSQAHNDGTLPLEPAMRVSQVVLEPALAKQLNVRGVPVHYGWGLDTFTQSPSGVTAELVATESGETRTIRAAYLVGCDGAGSRTRTQLGIGLQEIDLRRHFVKELGLRRTASSLLRNYRHNGQRPMDGRFYLVHFSTTDPDILTRFGSVWHLQSPEGWTVISQNDGDTFTLHAPLGIGTDAEGIDPREFVYACLGRRFDLEVKVANAWTPRLTLADSYGTNRVWLAGDAVHQVTPTGGYGMNTGVGDAVGLGWALAAQLQGWGAPGLLTSYAQERRAVAHRNRDAAARHAVVRGAVMSSDWTDMHSDRWNGEATRRRLGREIADLGNLENEALGIELGYRYDESPLVCQEADARPLTESIESYTPSTLPGSRPPSVYLEDGQALFDLFGAGFTLLRFTELDVDEFVVAAAQRALPLTVVDVRDPHARALYQRDLVLIRPDQHVAWRGNEMPPSSLHVIDRIRGAFA